MEKVMKSHGISKAERVQTQLYHVMFMCLYMTYVNH